MTDRYDGMDADALRREAKSRGIVSIGGSEDDAGTGVDKASKSDLQEALREFDEAQQTAVGAGGEDGDEGTAKNANREKQFPGAGDPKLETQKEGTSILGQARGDEK